MGAHSFEDLKWHIGHQIACVGYGRDKLHNAAIECETCNEVLVDFSQEIQRSPAYKTVIQVEILHEEPEWTEADLRFVEHEITEGGASGLVTIGPTKPLSLEELLRECVRHQTDPEFFLGEVWTEPEDVIDDVWDEDKDYPREDWQYEVANGDTNRGYWDWVAASKERDSE